MKEIRAEDWEWSGYPAHFSGSASCLWWLCTRVGDYIVSSIGDYRRLAFGATSAGHRNPAESLGSGDDQFYETMVFRAAGEVSDSFDHNGEEIDSDRYATAEDATLGHMEMCRKWAGRGW